MDSWGWLFQYGLEMARAVGVLEVQRLFREDDSARREVADGSNSTVVTEAVLGTRPVTIYCDLLKAE